MQFREGEIFSKKAKKSVDKGGSMWYYNRAPKKSGVRNGP